MWVEIGSSAGARSGVEEPVSAPGKAEQAFLPRTLPTANTATYRIGPLHNSSAAVCVLSAPSVAWGSRASCSLSAGPSLTPSGASLDS